MDDTIRCTPGAGVRAAQRLRAQARPAAPRSSDGGFTLVELVMAIVLSSIVGSVLVAALMTSLNAADSASSNVASSIDVQLISSFLAVDAQAAGGIDPGTAQEVVDLGVSTVADAEGWAGCVQSGALVVRFAWIDRSVSAADKVVVTYGLSPDGSLVRRACEPSGTTEAVLGRRVQTASVTCEPVSACSGLPDEVTLALVGGDSRAPFDVRLSASLRPEIQGRPTTLNSAQVPLLATGTATCPVLSVGGSGTTHVLGEAIVNSTCGASPISGDLTRLRVSGATSLLPSANDPFAASVPPADCAGSGGPNPTIGSSTGPDSVTVYPAPVTISSVVEFQPGRHVFCEGLTIDIGASVTGTGVLWYVADGGASVSSQATVSIAPATSGEYAGLLLWSAGSQTVTITSGVTVHDLAGVVYVPQAQLDLTSASGIRLGAVVADQVSIDGSGPTRIGQPSPTLAVAPTSLPVALASQSYSATAPTVSGGIAPYTYTATGLPLGLVMNTSGAISGTPTTTGTATVSFLAIDATGASIPFTRTLEVTGTPATPGSVAAAAGDTTAAVSWTAGVSSGAPTTIIYSVTATAAGLPTRTCSSTPPVTACTLTNLVNGVRYAVTVTAANAVGTSAPGTTSVTPRPAVLVSSNSRLWLDATDPDADGVVEGAGEQCDGLVVSCAAASNVLTRWEDKSGSNSDAVQSMSSRAGRYVPAMPAVNFDANGFYSATVRSGPDMTAFVVAQSDTSTWNTYGWLLSARRPNGLIIHPWAGNSTVGWYATNSAGSYLFTNERATPSITSPHIYDLTQAGSNPIVATGSDNGHVVAQTSFAGQTRTATSMNLRLGADDDCCGNRFGDGKYREVIVFDRALTTAERRVVQEYLARKWGVTLAPAAPTGVSALAADGGALVAWVPPTWNGGSPITGYRVTAVPGGATCTATAAATTCPLLGLTNGTAYAFVVTALNAMGTGVQSDVSNIVTPGPPPAPTAATAVAGDGRAAVSWTAPVLNGHAPLLSYTVTATAPGQATGTCTAAAPTTTCTVTGLTNHVSYTLSVTAANAHGNGPATTTTVVPTWTPTDLGSALTWWLDANDPAALTGAWVSQSGYTVSGALGSTRLAVSSGVVERIDVLAGGTGYTSVPTLTVSGGGGTGAAVSGTTVTGGAVASTMVPTRGGGYTSEPTVSVGGPGTGAQLRAFITAPVPVGATIRIAGSTYTVVDRDGLTLTVSPALTATATGATVEEWQISNWSNRATPGTHDAGQTTVVNRPALGTMAGRPAVVFDGVDSWMWLLDDAGASTFDHGPSWSVLVAYQAERQVGSGAVAQTGSGANARILASSGSGQADSASAENIQLNPGSGNDARNGGPVRILTAGANGADTFNWSRVFLGASATPSYSPGWGFTGRIGEVIFVNGGLDSTAVAKAQAYLTAKWAQSSSAPSAPIVVTPTVGDAEVSLTWRGANEYQSAITGYTATATAFGQPARACATTTLTCTITGLTNGAVYSVTVTATSGAGTGPASVPITVVARPALLTTSSSRLWLDGADIDGDGRLEGAIAETGLSTGAVQTWNDKSGRNNHTSAPAAGLRPSGAAQTMNGLPVITFDGTTILQGASASNPYGITGDRTMFVVTRRRSGTPSRLIDRIPEDSPLFDITGTNTLEVRDDNWGQYQSSIGTSATATNVGYIISANRSGTSLGIWSNGAVAGTSTITGVQTMRAITVGRHVAWSAPADADVAEVVLFDRALTSAERRQVEQYLQLKWSISLVPDAPTGVAASQVSGVVTVSWAAPASNGGAAITGYTATASPGGATCTSTGTSCTISGLTAGTAYTFAVAATNAVGIGSGAPSATLTWSPGPVTTGLIAWYDASDATSFTVSGATVARWSDKSGNNNHALASAGTVTYQAAAQNGLNTVRFNGSSTLLAPHSPSLNVTGTGLSIIVVYRSTAVNGNWAFVNKENTWEVGERGSGGGFTAAVRGGCWVWVANLPAASGAWHTATFRYSPSWLFTVDSGPVVTAPSPCASSITPSTSGLTLGGRGNGGAPSLTGDLAEVLIFDRALTDAENDQIRASLKAKWGTP